MDLGSLGEGPPCCSAAFLAPRFGGVRLWGRAGVVAPFLALGERGVGACRPGEVDPWVQEAPWVQVQVDRALAAVARGAPVEGVPYCVGRGRGRVVGPFPAVPCAALGVLLVPGDPFYALGRVGPFQARVWVPGETCLWVGGP